VQCFLHCVHHHQVNLDEIKPEAFAPAAHVAYAMAAVIPFVASPVFGKKMILILVYV
jgi:hypothetical protein